jgi:L-threonylcarbamoyladenylate synthase
VLPTDAVYASQAVLSASGLAAGQCRSMPVLAADCAHELFAQLRALDQTGAARIWVQAPPADAAWDGVRDRLQRASA